MKHATLTLLVLMGLFSYNNVYTQNQQTHPYLNFSPVANPTFNNTPIYNNEVNPIITCTATSLSYAVAIALRDYLAPWADTIKNSLTKNNYQLLKAIINKFLWKHKYIIIGNTLLGSYITTSIVLLSDDQFINNHERWCHWKDKHSFEELCALPQHQLQKELLIAINKRHCNNQNPTDINHPLMRFINDINNEIQIINRYITVASLQKKLHCIKIFPTNEDKIKKAEQLLTRAHFIRHLFLSWLAEYNLCNA